MSKTRKAKKQLKGRKGRARLVFAPAVIMLPEVGFVRLPVVLAHTGLGKSTLWVMVKNHKFPAPLKLSPGNIGWNVVDVRAWIAERIAAAQGAPQSAPRADRARAAGRFAEAAA